MKRLIHLAVVLLSLVYSADASAALFFTFSTKRATPGSFLRVQTAGHGALLNVPRSARLQVYLAPAAEAGAIASARDPRLVRVGRLNLDQDGDGSLRFVVPDLPPGRYVTLTQCEPCARFSAGRALLPTGPFGRPFVIAKSEGGSPLPWIVIGSAAAVAAVGGAAGWRRKQKAPNG